MCRFIFFQFPHHHFLKRPSLLLFSNIGWLYLCDSIFEIFFSVLLIFSFNDTILSFLLELSFCLEVVLFEFLNFPWHSYDYFRMSPLLSNSESVSLYPQKSCAENFLLCLNSIHKIYKRNTYWQYWICLTIDMEHQYI